MSAFPKSDRRIKQILDQLGKFSAGNYTATVHASDENDGLDAIVAGLNALGNALLTQNETTQKKEQKIDRLLETLVKYTALDFSQRAEVHGDGDEIDAMAVGLNALGEEVVFHIDKLKESEAEIRQLNATLEQRVRDRTEEVNRSELKYRHLFQNNPMPLWILELDTLKFIDVNESALSLYGYTREEFLSMSSVELRPEEERTRYLHLDRTAGGTRNTGIWKHRKKDGTIIHAEVIVHEIDFEGRSARFILANDVTDKVNALRELQMSEARFRRIFESKMIGFLFWDDSGKVVEANDLFLEMVGYTRSDLQAGLLRLDQMIPPEYGDAGDRAWEQLELRGVCDPFEEEYIRKDGIRLPVMVGAAYMGDGPHVKGVAFVMDISQRKRMEEEIRQLNRDLEIRIDQRTRALQEVNKELESFTYSVSHDLRAPLRAIHGYAQMLQEDYGEKLETNGIRLLLSIKSNAVRMGRLVDDLLAFSRVGKIAVSKGETDLTRLVGEVVDECMGGENRHVEVLVHPLGIARADGILLRQVFQNLISNALKYSSKKEHPVIEIGVKQLDDHERAWFVKDNGAGFDMAYYRKLFGVFERLHEQEEFEGTGVGLAIVQRIVQRHGGRVWAEGRVGEGAVFYFTLGE